LFKRLYRVRFLTRFTPNNIKISSNQNFLYINASAVGVPKLLSTNVAMAIEKAKAKSKNAIKGREVMKENNFFIAFRN
jgi:hypothetical protein